MSEEMTEAYIASLYEDDPDLRRVLESIRAQKMPEISIAPGYGRLLTFLARLSGAKAALEIGALGGYSGICLARGLGAEGRLTSLELNPAFAELAKANMAAAGLGGRVEYRIGEALTSLAQLEQEGRQFDLFFIDADKGNYPNYLDWALRLGRPGALIIGDNALLHGRIANPEINSPSVNAIRTFNRRMASDPRLESVFLPAYDGLIVARIR